MKLHRILLLILYSFTVLGLINAQSQPSDWVNPNVGGISPFLENTVPLVSLPNSMMRIHKLPGNYLSEKISGFPFVVCGHRMGTAGLLMPISGKISKDRNQWKSYYDHDFEVAKPYFYSVWLKEPDINVELAVAEKSSFYQLQWNKNDEKHLMLGLTANGEIAVKNINTVEGFELYENKVKVYFCLKTNKAFTVDSIWNDKTPALALTFNMNNKQKLGVKMGISFISIEQARKNLENDIHNWDFEATKSKGRERWNKELGKIEVKGGTDDQKTVFYTALYRTYERMVNISEDGQYYSGFDNTVHADNGIPFFTDDWMWDTYRAAHPLQALLNPDLESYKIQSYVRMYKQSGWMPSFPVLWGDHACMNGHHSAAIIADAYFKGIHNFDIETAYSGLRKNAMEATMLPWTNGSMCALDSFYLEKGYYPALAIGEKETEPRVHEYERRQSVAITLAHSYDDWCLAQLANALGKNEDAKYFYNRSQNFRKLFNSKTGFFEPRTKDGNWVENFDVRFSGGVGARDYFDECNGWTYLWDVQHDIPGLIELLGGKQKFIKKIDQLFIEELGTWKTNFYAQFPDATGLVGQFVMGNEPSLHIPYLYNYSGAPWKTQDRVRMLLDTWFTNSPFGMPGDEDGGGISAWVVFSSIGIYPVTPGIPNFSISSSIFTDVKIKVAENKYFIIKADKSSRQNKYIQSATLNGKEWDNTSISWDAIKNGGELKLVLGNKPNYKWGVNYLK